MLHKLTVPSAICGEHRPVGHIFDVPDGAQPPGSHVQGEAGQLIFRPYAEPLTPHEIDEYHAEQAVLKAEADLTRAQAEEAALAAQEQPAPPVPKGQKVRLTAPAFINGALREAGYEFFLPEGEKGPTQAVRTGHERIDMAKDSLPRLDAEVVDEPLYEVIG